MSLGERCLVDRQLLLIALHEEIGVGIIIAHIVAKHHLDPSSPVVRAVPPLGDAS